MDVSDLLDRDIDFIAPDDSLREAEQKMSKLNVTIMPVFENNRPLGMLNKTDIAEYVSGSDDGPEDIPVRLLLK